MMKETIRTDGIIFDLDGTLWDAAASTTIAWNEALDTLGYGDHQIDEDTVRSVSGLRVEDIFDKVFHFMPRERHTEFFDTYRLRQARILKERGGKIYPHAEQVLIELKKQFRLFIVSNCLTGYIENFLAFSNLGYLFDDFECSGKTGMSKSKNITLVAERNQLTSPVYVGDTIWDYEASTASGLPFVHAGYGFGKVDQATHRIDTLEDLKDLLVTA